MPTAPRLGLFPGPLALAAGCGLLTAASFALWPLARALRIPGAALFRDPLLPARAWPPRPLLLANAALAAALVALVVASAENRGFALGFCAAAAATLVLFRLGGAALTLAVARLPAPRRAWARLGLANLHRPGSADAADAGLGRAWADDTGGGGAGRGQSAARGRRTDAGGGAELLLHRPPERPDARLPPPDRRRAGRLRPGGGAQPARPRGGGERRAGRAGEGDAGQRLGAARRPRPDLCGGDAARHAAGGRRVVAGGLSRPAAGVVRRRAGARLGGDDRRHDPGERARPRHRPAHRQPARHRLAQPGAEFRAGRQPRPAGARAAHAYRDGAGRTRRCRRGCCNAVTDAFPNVSAIRVADVLAGGCRPARPGGRRRWPPPGRWRWGPGRWCWPARSRRGSGGGCRRR